MPNPTLNPAKYEAAQRKVRAGQWIVNPDTGVISNAQGPLGFVRGRYWCLAIFVNGKDLFVYAHRVIWEATNGPIPLGLQINHKNGDKLDNRVANLEVVTGAENCQHAYRTGLHVAARGEDQANALLTNDQVREIKAQLVAGAENAALAQAFGVHKGTIASIRGGENWRHIPFPSPEDVADLEVIEHQYPVGKCSTCDSEMPMTLPFRKYCSKYCQTKAKNAAAKAKHAKPCELCGKTMHPDIYRNQRYCSIKHAKQAHMVGKSTPIKFRDCRTCGATMIDRAGRVYCGDECRPAHKRRANREQASRAA